MSFFQTWFTGIIRPHKAFDRLKMAPAPLWGLVAILCRMGIGAAVNGLCDALYGTRAFMEPALRFIPQEHYRTLAVFVIVPLVSFVLWLLMSAVAHLIFRLGGKPSDFDAVLNVVGLGMLIVMPVSWLWDWGVYATHSYGLVPMAISHSALQLWETALEALGFHRNLGVGVWWSVAAAVAINAVWILVMMIFVR